MRARLLTPAILLCLGAGCDNNFTPEWKVEGFRVLGFQAEPADLKPGETTSVTPLIVDASRAGQPNIVAWLACDPDPAHPERSSCSNTDALQSLAFPLSADGDLPPGVRRLGVGGTEPVSYTAPGGLFDGLAAGDVTRTNGVVAQLLAYAIAEDPAVLASEEGSQALAARIQSRSVPTILSLFRIRVSEDPQVNHNPVPSAISADGIPLPADRPWRISPNGTARLESSFPAGTQEIYQQPQPDGVATRTERLAVAYYVTEGEVEEPKAFTDSGLEQRFIAPPEGGARGGQLWAVVRDTRGGQGFLQRALFFCDPVLADPSVASFEVRDDNGVRRIQLSGSGLGATLELTVGEQPVTRLQISDTQLEGVLPTLPAGSYPVVVRGKNCRDFPAPRPYLAP